MCLLQVSSVLCCVCDQNHNLIIPCEMSHLGGVIFLHSLAVSVKMSVLLYAPGWLVILLLTHGIYPTMSLLFTYCALPQVYQLAYNAL